MRDFQQMTWNAEVEADCRALVRLARQEDLNGGQDWTSMALAPADRQGEAAMVAREAGIVAGMAALPAIAEEMQCQIASTVHTEDGQQVAAGTMLASFSGPVRDLLLWERTALNLVSRLMGIATLTHTYVEQAAGTKARVYDTRKTTPGWRRLEKYAVQCGGGRNHRMGLFDAILIKDNHLAQLRETLENPSQTAAEAVQRARLYLREGAELSELPIEIEIDTWEQLTVVLPTAPDIVLLDNMTLAQLASAVALRDSVAPQVELEASGGVTLETLRKIAETGVDRISVGALTHSARSSDIGLDWKRS